MEIRFAPYGSTAYHDAVVLRNEVLRHPLGLVLTADELALDAQRDHLVAVHQGKVVGSVSLYIEEPGVVRIKQMAVAEDQRGGGVGARLLDAAEMRGRTLDATRALLHARCTAERFYRRQGYKTIGEEFPEQGIPHVRMEKALA